MNTSFIMIEPHYSDPDTFCTFTLGNGSCRASIDMYVDEAKLLVLVDSLETTRHVTSAPELDFMLTDEMCMNIGFTLLKTENGNKLIATMVNVFDDVAPFRAEIHFNLNNKESSELASELLIWLKNPISQFIWKK
jgi:hypothetical protein